MKINIAILILSLALLLPYRAQANPVAGVAVTGSCASTSPIASQVALLGMDAALTELQTTMIKSLVEAIQAQTMALQASESKIAQGGQIVAGQRAEEQMKANARIDAYSRMQYDLPVGYCFDPAYYMQRAKEDTSAAAAMMAASERNMGMGSTSSSKERAEELRVAAKSAEQNAFPFASDTLTPEQAAGLADMVQVLFSSTKNPRPQSLKQGSIEESKYLTNEMAASLFRTLATQPYRQFEMDRYPYALYKELEAWAGQGVSSPFTISYDVDEKTGMVKDVSGKMKPIGPDDKVSLLTIYDLVGKRFTSKDFLSQVDAMKSAGVLKEIIRLLGFEYNVMLDMRNFMQYSNVLQSLALIEQYENMNKKADSVIK